VPDADILFRGAQLADGSGAPARRGDLAVSQGRIVALGDCGDWRAATVIDADGLWLAPGFIDVHTHDDRLLTDDPAMAAKTSQGVTTVVTGNCGVSVAPLGPGDLPEPILDLARHFRFGRFADWMAHRAANPAATNVACLVGHSSLRVAAMADIARPATTAERETMRTLCREALDAGAIGLSSGLFYKPAMPAPWEEVAELVAEVGAVGGIYTAHIRDEGDTVLDAIDEACRIAQAGSARLVISHHKVAGKANFGRSAETLARIEAAMARQPVAFDVYPYVAGSSLLSAELAATAGRTIVTWSDQQPDAAGRDLAELAAEMGLSIADAVDRLKPGGATYFMMDEADVRRILAHPDAMIGSDGIDGPHPHPRLWGTFPRVLGHYARDLGLFPMADAVRRMTALSAERFGLAGRGRLAQGFHADLVLFDPEAIAEAASFERPAVPSHGIIGTWVNGARVWDAKGSTGACPGALLRRGDS
jgi:N-acyl-D-amino-acid deacylase